MSTHRRVHPPTRDPHGTPAYRRQSPIILHALTHTHSTILAAHRLDLGRVIWVGRSTIDAMRNRMKPTQISRPRFPTQSVGRLLNNHLQAFGSKSC